MTTMEQRRALAEEEDTLKSLADAYFLIEGENPKQTSDFWFEKKKEAWKKDPECYAFFLLESFRNIRTTKGLSSTDLLDYFRTNAQEQALSRM